MSSSIFSEARLRRIQLLALPQCITLSFRIIDVNDTVALQARMRVKNHASLRQRIIPSIHSPSPPQYFSFLFENAVSGAASQSLGDPNTNAKSNYKRHDNPVGFSFISYKSMPEQFGCKKRRKNFLSTRLSRDQRINRDPLT